MLNFARLFQQLVHKFLQMFFAISLASLPPTESQQAKSYKLVSLKQLNGLEPTVQIFNPCDAVREVLQITKLNTMIEIHQVDV